MRYASKLALKGAKPKIIKEDKVRLEDIKKYKDNINLLQLNKTQIYTFIKVKRHN